MPPKVKYRNQLSRDERLQLFINNTGVAYAQGRTCRAPGVEFDDASQEALEALWSATRSFNGSRGKFSAHAHAIVSSRLQNFVARASRVVRIPNNIQRTSGHVRRIKGLLAQAGYNLTAKEVIDNPELVPAEISATVNKYIKYYHNAKINLTDISVETVGTEEEFFECLPPNLNLEDMSIDDKLDLTMMVNSLPSPECEIVALRIQGWMLREIAVVYNKSTTTIMNQFNEAVAHLNTKFGDF